MDSRVFVAVGLTILPWASAFAGIRAGLQDYTPAHLTLLRFLVASGVMLMYALLVGCPCPSAGTGPFTAYTIWAGTLPLLLFWPGLQKMRAASQATWSVGVLPGGLSYLTWNYALGRAPG